MEAEIDFLLHLREEGTQWKHTVSFSHAIRHFVNKSSDFNFSFNENVMAALIETKYIEKKLAG